MRVAEADREAALKALRKLCPPGSTIFTIVRHVSRSGMSRVISSYVIRKNKPRWLDGLISKVLDYHMHKHHEGLVVSGCGMNMGFHVVYSLSSALYGAEKRGGYKLNQEWL